MKGIIVLLLILASCSNADDSSVCDCIVVYGWEKANDSNIPVNVDGCAILKYGNLTERVQPNGEIRTYVTYVDDRSYKFLNLLSKQEGWCR